MIENEKQCEQSIRILSRLEVALAALRKKIEPSNEELFQVMAQSYVKEIREIRKDIDNYIGVDIAKEYSAPLWMTLEGTTLNSTFMPTSLISTWLNKFRIVIQNISEFIDTQKIPTGRPSAFVCKVSEPKLIAIHSGSIKFGLGFSDSYLQGDLFEVNVDNKQSLPIQTLSRIFELLSYIEKNTVFPNVQFPNNDETIVILSQLFSMVPSSRGKVNSLKFTGVITPHDQKIRLNSTHRKKIQTILDSLTTLHEDSVEGVVREIDLDAQRIILRERGPTEPDLKCYLPDELLDKAESLVNKVVRVQGKISSQTPDIVTVESIEEI